MFVAGAARRTWPKNAVLIRMCKELCAVIVARIFFLVQFAQQDYCYFQHEVRILDGMIFSNCIFSLKKVVTCCR
jgi:hypothetical protein